MTYRHPSLCHKKISLRSQPSSRGRRPGDGAWSVYTFLYHKKKPGFRRNHHPASRDANGLNQRRRPTCPTTHPNVQMDRHPSAHRYPNTHRHSDTHKHAHRRTQTTTHASTYLCTRAPARVRRYANRDHHPIFATGEHCHHPMYSVDAEHKASVLKISG